MTNSSRTPNWAAIQTVGEELRLLLHEEQPPLIKDRRYHLKTYPQCFVGSELVDWLMSKGEVASRAEAVAMMQKLCENGVVHHVCDDHFFKDEKLFFRFRKDDGTYQEPPNTVLLAKGQELYSRLSNETPSLIQDRKYLLTMYKSCFVGSQFVDWLIHNGEASNREEAVQIGRELLDAGIFVHVCYDHHFKDEYLFYRFKCDEKKSDSLVQRLIARSPTPKKISSGSPTLRSPNPGSAQFHECKDAYHQPTEPFGVGGTHRLSDISPQSPLEASPNLSPSSLQFPIGTSRPTPEELCDTNGSYVKRSINVTSDPVGYGFVIRGFGPIHVHSVDPNGPAAAAGLTVDEYLYSVNGQVVLNSSHTEAAKIILRGRSTASLVTFIKKGCLPPQS